MSWLIWTLLKHMLSLLYWPDLLEQGVVVALQVAFLPRLCSPAVAGAHCPQTWLTAWLPVCCCLGVIRQLVLGSCLCCLPKPARDLCATGHLAQESQLPATPCLSPDTHHVPERCRKIWLPRASSAEACLSFALASACPQGLEQPGTSSRCHFLPGKCWWLLGTAVLAALACSKQLRYLTLLLQRLLSCFCSLLPPICLHPVCWVSMEWSSGVNTPFCPVVLSAPLSWITQGLLLLIFAGSDENLPFSPLTHYASAFFHQSAMYPRCLTRSFTCIIYGLLWALWM